MPLILSIHFIGPNSTNESLAQIFVDLPSIPYHLPITVKDLVYQLVSVVSRIFLILMVLHNICNFRYLTKFQPTKKNYEINTQK